MMMHSLPSLLCSSVSVRHHVAAALLYRIALPSRYDIIMTRGAHGVPFPFLVVPLFMRGPLYNPKEPPCIFHHQIEFYSLHFDSLFACSPMGTNFYLWNHYIHFEEPLDHYGALFLVKRVLIPINGPLLLIRGPSTTIHQSPFCILDLTGSFCPSFFKCPFPHF